MVRDDHTPSLSSLLSKNSGTGLRACAAASIEKAAKPLFRERSHGGRGSFSCEKVTPSTMRSVISDAHPPGGPLLPLRGNSPCVAGENRFQFFRACGRELCEAFSTYWRPRRRRGRFCNRMYTKPACCSRVGGERSADSCWRRKCAGRGGKSGTWRT